MPGRIPGKRGFTQIELMIVVSIIGLLTVMAIPSFRKAVRRSGDVAFANDLRVYSAAAERAAMERGDYPPDETNGVLPSALADYLRSSVDWSEKTPIGGQWDWVRAERRGETVHGVFAGIAVIGPARTTAQMGEVDDYLDDGDLTTGKFQKHDDRYVYNLE